MTNPNDAGRWPVYEETIGVNSGGLAVLTRNGVEIRTGLSWDRDQIVSDFTALTAENRRLREEVSRLEAALYTWTNPKGDRE